MAQRSTLDFLRTEAASGVVLGLAALTALVMANSPLSDAYFSWLKSDVALQIGSLRLQETVAEWIKEGLMALFFLVVGLEIKHEILRGELSDPRRLATPVLAALGGMIVPALVYLAVSAGLGGPAGGWPIPLATDIAFALAVFAVVGRGLPTSLRVFLLTLAIVDDLGAIVLIAVLFSGDMVWQPALWAGLLLAAGAMFASRHAVTPPFWVVGFALVWWLNVESGLSTSLGAVAFAMIVPVDARRGVAESPVKQAMHDLHPYVAYLVLPLFAFAKAGVAFTALSPGTLAAPLVVSVALGLFLGKQAGIMGATWLATRLKLGKRPRGASWREVYGVALLCGVGFTMSLFIGALAVPGAIDSPEQTQVKLGVLIGSFTSAALGVAVLSGARRRKLRVPFQAKAVTSE